MKITFLGHAGFLLEDEAIRVAIDPFLTDNPVAVHKHGEIQADFILVTHGHSDHLGDSIEIAKNCGATIIAIVEIARYCSARGAKTHGLNMGGGVCQGPLHVRLVQAWHSSSMGNNPAEYLGIAGGFIISIAGKTIYHPGDTAIFGDMALLGKLYPIDVAFLPIGDNYTMGPREALEAVGLLRPKMVIPMHYNTWPVIEQDGEAFKQEVEKLHGVKVTLMNPGTEIII